MHAELEGGALRRLVCEPPLAAKVCRDELGGRALWLVSSGASLLEGDELTLSVSLSGGARLAVRSVAAQLVHPCPDGGRARLRIEAKVGEGCSLLWAPEPTIVSGAANYVSDAVVAVAEGGALRWQEELVLGRTGEDVGSIDLDVATAIDVAGVPCWRDGLGSHPGWRGPAVLGGARYLGTQVRVGAARPAGCGDGWLPLASGGEARRVLALDPAEGRQRLARPR